MAARVGDSIVEGDIPGVTFLGVKSPDDGNGLPEGVAGAFIEEVTPSSAVDGVVEEGDVVVAVEGHPVRDFEALAAFIGSYLPGDKITLTVIRDDDRMDLQVGLGERPENLVVR